MESLGRSVRRASDYGTYKGKLKKAKLSKNVVGKEVFSAAVLRMAERYANGQDIWTGEPLIGSDAHDWLRIQCQAAPSTRVSAESKELGGVSPRPEG